MSAKWRWVLVLLVVFLLVMIAMPIVSMMSRDCYIRGGFMFRRVCVGAPR